MFIHVLHRLRSRLQETTNVNLSHVTKLSLNLFLLFIISTPKLVFTIRISFICSFSISRNRQFETVVCRKHVTKFSSEIAITTLLIIT